MQLRKDSDSHNLVRKMEQKLKVEIYDNKGAAEEDQDCVEMVKICAISAKKRMRERTINGWMDRYIDRQIDGEQLQL